MQPETDPLPHLEEHRGPAEWDGALEAFDFVPPGQAAAWAGTRDCRGHEVLRFTSQAPGAVAAQGVLRRSLGLARFVVDDGPILGKACDEDALVGFVGALRRRLGPGCALSFSSVQPHEARHELWLRRAGLQRPSSLVRCPMTLYVDCADAAGLEAGFHAAWRRSLRKAARSGVEFEPAALSDARAVRDLLDVYAETFRLRNAVGDVDAATLAAVAPDPRWRLFFATHAGRRVSARLVFVSGAQAFDYIGGTTAAGRELSSSHVLVARTLAHLHGAGVRTFDFGRIGPGRYDSIDRFKLGSGGRPVAYLGEWSSSAHAWYEPALGVVRFLKGRERW